MNKFFADASGNNAERNASFNSEFQQRLNTMTSVNVMLRNQEQAAKVAVIEQLDADIELAFA